MHAEPLTNLREVHEPDQRDAGLRPQGKLKEGVRGAVQALHAGKTALCQVNSAETRWLQ